LITLREEHRLRVFEKRVPSRIFGAERDEVTGEWRKLHNEELNDLYCSPNTVRVVKWGRMRLTGHVEHMEERVGVYRASVGKPGERNMSSRSAGLLIRVTSARR
jgi:hypothetical protein